MIIKDDEIVQLAQLALLGRAQDVHAYLRKLIRKAGPEQKGLVNALTSVLASAPNQAGVLRDAAAKMLPVDADSRLRSEEHTSELQSLMRISYAVFCLKKKNKKCRTHSITNSTYSKNTIQ